MSQGYPLQRHPPASTAANRGWWRGSGLRPASLAILLIVIVTAHWTVAHAQEAASVVNREDRIKAAYLFQFGRYVEWPATAFVNPQTPFVIGILEWDLTAANLKQIAEIKKIQDRPIEVRLLTASSGALDCHILFLSSSVSAKMQAEFIRQLSEKPVLIVGESVGFLDRGGMINFVVEENKIRLHIARKAAELQGLSVSAKLLQVARIVDR